MRDIEIIKSNVKKRRFSILKTLSAVALLVFLAAMLFYSLPSIKRDLRVESGSLSSSTPSQSDPKNYSSNQQMKIYEALLVKTGAYDKIMAAYTEHSNNYINGSIDSIAFIPRSKQLYRDLEKIRQELKPEIQKLSNETLRPKADQWYEGTGRIDEGIRLINSGITSGHKPTVETGKKMVAEGQNMLNSADLLHYR